MKFSEEKANAHHQINGYGDGWVQVNGRRVQTPCIITPEQLIENWQANQPGTLEGTDLDTLFAFQAEVILVGTGGTQILSSTLHHALVGHGIGFEVMSNAAACRTYNVLLAEGRAVVTALFR